MAAAKPHETRPFLYAGCIKQVSAMAHLIAFVQSSAVMLCRRALYASTIIQRHDVYTAIPTGRLMYMARRFLHPYIVWLLLLFLPANVRRLGTVPDHGGYIWLYGVRSTLVRPRVSLVTDDPQGTQA